MTENGKRELISELTEHLKARWSGMPRDILLPGFGLLSEGRPVPVEQLAIASGREVEVVTEAIRSAPVELDQQGRITNIFGFKFAPTRHRVEFDGVALFSCCALWAHFIPRLVGRAAHVESVDPISNLVVRLDISPSGVHSTEPAGVAASLLQTCVDDLLSDVGAQFCCHINHFESRQTAEEFVGQDARRYVVEIEEMNRIAHDLSQSLWLR